MKGNLISQLAGDEDIEMTARPREAHTSGPFEESSSSFSKHAGSKEHSTSDIEVRKIFGAHSGCSDCMKGDAAGFEQQPTSLGW